VLNLRSNSVDNACGGRRFQVVASYLSKVANFNLPYLHLAPPFGVTPFDFWRDLRHQKTRVRGLSCCVICVILRLAVSVNTDF